MEPAPGAGGGDQEPAPEQDDDVDLNLDEEEWTSWCGPVALSEESPTSARRARGEDEAGTRRQVRRREAPRAARTTGAVWVRRSMPSWGP